MPTKYLDEEGLSHVVDLAKKKFADKKELWNWQKTEKAGAVAFEPVPDSVLEPMVEFKFKETLPAEGEKGPDNPSTIESVNSVMVTRCGKNLCPTSTLYRNYNDITVVSNSDGSLTLNGTAKNDIDFYAELYHKFNGVNDNSLVLKNEIEYTVSISGDSGIRFYLYKTSSTTEDRAYGNPYINIVSGETASIVLPPETTGLIFRVVIPAGTTVDNVTVKIQLEEGNSVTEFEPYCGTNYVLSLRNTYYGGSVNFATGVMTVTQKAKAFDGTENWQLAPNVIDGYKVFFCTDFHVSSGIEINDSTQRCTHYSVLGDLITASNHFYVTSNRTWFITTEQSVNDFKVFLAQQHSLGTPVTVVCKNEDETIQLTSTQIKSLASIDKYEPRINTIYTDAESVQVGYQKFTAEGNFVHTTGNETIEGVKTFANATPGSTAGDSVTDLTIRNPAVVRGVRGEGVNWSRMIFADKEGDTEGNFAGRLGIFEIRSPKTNEYNNNGGEQFRFKCYKYSDNASDYSKSSDIILGYDKDGIAYATAPSTSIDRSVDTDIVTRDWLPKDTRIPQKSDLWNWQKTEKGGAVAFKPVPESELEPVVDFMFTETLPAEGEKSPENPSTITGVSSIHVTRSGKNLLDISSLSSSTSHGITFTPSADGSISISGTYTSASAYYTLRDNLYLPAGETLYLSIKEGPHSSLYNAVLQLVAYDANNAEISIIWQRLNANPIPITIPNGVKYRIRLGVFNTLDPSAPVVITPMAEHGSLSQEWVPFEDYDLYTIPFDDTYYGGSIDLKTGIMNVHSQKVTIDENCKFSYLGGLNNNSGLVAIVVTIYQLEITKGYIVPDSCICDRFPIFSTETVEFTKIGLFVPNLIHAYFNYKQFRFYLSLEMLGVSSTATQEEVENAAKDWFTSNPTDVVFTFDKPFSTIQLSPTQIYSFPSIDKYSPKLNTIYTDQESVQVGYQRYADENAPAPKLQTSVSLKTNLASTTAISFDGSTDQNSIPVSGVLSISNGGTGSSTQNFVDLSNSQVINGVKTFGSTIEGVVDRSIKDGSGNVIANTYATKAVATSLVDGLMSSTDKSKLDSIGTVFAFKGSVADAASLPGSGNTAGDAYLVQSPLGLQAWNGTSWVDIGSSALLPISDNEIDAVFA